MQLADPGRRRLLADAGQRRETKVPKGERKEVLRRLEQTAKAVKPYVSVSPRFLRSLVRRTVRIGN
jgi:hypothetical protein